MTSVEYSGNGASSGPAQIPGTPPSSLVSAIQYRANFATTAGWAATSATLTADTVNTLTGASSLNIAAPAGVKSHKVQTNGLSVSLSGRQAFWRFYVDPSQVANIATVYFGITDNGGLYREYDVWQGAWQTANTNPNGGWYSGSVSLEDPNYANDNLAFNFANVASILYGFDTVAGYPVANVTFDDVYFFTPKNTTPIIFLYADGAYSNAYTYCNYAKGVNTKAAVHMAINQSYVDVAGHMSSAQIGALSNAGHRIGMYGNAAAINTLWISQTPAQKLTIISLAQQLLATIPVPKPLWLTISGTGGWVPSDDAAYLGKYFYSAVGSNDNGGNQLTQGLATPQYLLTTTFVTTTALIAVTATVNTSTGIWTLAGAQNWTRIAPVRFSTSGTLPTTAPQIAAGPIYWMKMTSTTTGSLHPTAKDAVNGTNAITASTTGTGTQTITSYDSATFGQRIAAAILSNGLVVQGAHISTAGELTVGQFVLDALGSIVNAGQAQFVAIDDLLAGRVS